MPQYAQHGLAWSTYLTCCCISRLLWKNNLYLSFYIHMWYRRKDTTDSGGVGECWSYQLTASCQQITMFKIPWLPTFVLSKELWRQQRKLLMRVVGLVGSLHTVTVLAYCMLCKSHLAFQQWAVFLVKERLKIIHCDNMNLAHRSNTSKSGAPRVFHRKHISIF